MVGFFSISPFLLCNSLFYLFELRLLLRELITKITFLFRIVKWLIEVHQLLVMKVIVSLLFKSLKDILQGELNVSLMLMLEVGPAETEAADLYYCHDYCTNTNSRYQSHVERAGIGNQQIPRIALLAQLHIITIDYISGAGRTAPSLTGSVSH